MKKGLLLTLVIAALISSSVFAFAPVLNDLPDVVIGDSEQGNSNNFFVFSDAFVFDTYVTDQDSTIADMKWSFQGTDPLAQKIAINGLDEETADLTGEDPTNDLRAVSSTASFRNDTLSPRTGTTPYPNPTALENVVIAMYVSDGDFVVSQPITVYSVDDGVDGLSQGEIPTWTEKFAAQGQWIPWAAFSGTAPSSIASFDSANGRISLKFPTATLPSPSFFQWLESATPPATGVNMQVAYAANTMYVLKARLAADANTTVPYIRLRAQASDNIWTSCLTTGIQEDLGQTGGQFGAPQVGGTDFRMVFQPQGSTADAFIAADSYQASAYTGEVYIDELNLYALEIGTDVTLATAQTVSSFSTGWYPAGTGVTIGASSITIADPGTTWFANAGAFITLPTAVAPGDYYRIRYNISKNAVSNPAEQLRLRAADTANGGYGSNYVYNDNNGSATLHFSTTPQGVYLWHSTMNNRSTTFGADLSVYVDHIESNTAATNASIILNSIVIEKVTNEIILN